MNATTPIGFVVPAYNAERTIGDTLRSLQSQSFQDWTAVVVDDGSSDTTSTVTESFHEPRITLLKQTNGGVARARNAGLRACRADNIAFIDADDVIHPRYAERMLNGLDTQSDAVACWHSIVGPSLQDLGWTAQVAREELALNLLCRFNPLAIGAVLMRREALCQLADLEGFDGASSQIETPFRSEDGILADWGHWLRTARSGIRWAPEIAESLYLYRMIDGSLSRDVRAMCDDGLRMIERYSPPHSLAVHTRSWRVRCIARAIAQGDTEAVREYLTQLGAWTTHDRDVLVGALRWAFQFHAQVGPANASQFSAAWQGSIERALPDFPWPDSIRRAIVSPRDRWDHAARRAIAMLTPGDRLVMYGTGRNGHECAATLTEMRIEFEAVDDRSGSGAHATVTLPASIDPRCVVLITPDNHAALTDTLRRRGVTRLVHAEP